MFEIIDIITYAQEAWPFVVSAAAAIGGGTVGILNFQKLKKIRLEIKKLESELPTQASDDIDIIIPTKSEVEKYSNLKIHPDKKWPRS